MACWLTQFAQSSLVSCRLLLLYPLITIKMCLFPVCAYYNKTLIQPCSMLHFQCALFIYKCFQNINLCLLKCQLILLFCFLFTDVICLSKCINYTSGIVKVSHNGDWRYVCDDYWSTADANVACRQLGFLGYGNET